MYLKNFMMLLKRYTVSSVLNIAGMAVALAAVYLIMVQVNFDFSYNKSIPNAENIYRLEYPDWGEKGYWSTTWTRQLPDDLCKAVPEIEKCASIWPSGSYEEVYPEYSRKCGENVENYRFRLCECEREGLDIFGIEVIEGSLDDFINPYTILLKESVAKKYGLSAGDVLYYGRGADERWATATVVAVCKDPSAPSILDECDGWAGMQPQEEENAGNWNTPYYLQLSDGASASVVETKLRGYLLEQLREQGGSTEHIAEAMNRVYPRLNPLTELYFSDDVSMARHKTGNKSTTYTLLAIAVLIMVIALINFVNFFFALIPVRIRAINTYKIFGAPTLGLRLNFLMETVGLVFIALGGAVLLVYLFAETPFVKHLSTDIDILDNWPVAITVAAIAVVAGVVASIYPAWYITRFSPAMVLGGFYTTAPGRRLRYTLLAVQYFISITLIICSLSVHRQHEYMLGYDMGFQKERLLTVSVPYEAIWDGYDQEQGVSYTRRDAFLNALKSNPAILDVCFGNGPLVSPKRMSWGRELNGEPVYFQCYPVSWNFLEMMGIDIVDGRNFRSNDEYGNGAFIFNKDGADKFGIEVGCGITGHLGDEAEVVGICENFNFRPMQYNIEPFAFYIFGKHPWNFPGNMYIRAAAGTSLQIVREYIMQTIAEFAPNTPADSYDVVFFESELEWLYTDEENIASLFILFTMLSIVISVIGVFGLVLFETQFRRREIGIRRVHGASIYVILGMFNMQYLRIVALCSIVSIPVSIILIKRWSTQFAYQAPLSVLVFVLAVAVVALITVITVTLRSYKAANSNPVDAIQR